MNALLKEIESVSTLRRFGRVARIEGLLVEVTGAAGAISLGGQVRLTSETGKEIPCEVVGFSEGHALAMPFAALEGVRRGCRALVQSAAGSVRPSERWLGRVINAMGEPIDGLGPLPPGPAPYAFCSSPPRARRPVARGKRGSGGAGGARQNRGGGTPPPPPVSRRPVRRTARPSL